MFFLCNHSDGGWVGKIVKGDGSNFSQNSPLLIYSHGNSGVIFLSSNFYLKLGYKKEIKYLMFHNVLFSLLIILQVQQYLPAVIGLKRKE